MSPLESELESRYEGSDGLCLDNTSRERVERNKHPEETRVNVNLSEGCRCSCGQCKSVMKMLEGNVYYFSFVALKNTR